jgi:glycosyltransferase involved in cell wall biosynthesis
VFSHSSLAAGRACRHARVPYLVRPLGTLDPWSLEQKRVRKQLLLRWGARQLLDGAAGMHYTTDEEQRLAEAAVGGLPEGSVVPIGIDDAFFATPTRERAMPRYVLLLARLDAKKGVDLLIRAFHEATADAGYASWKLIIAGDGDPGFVSGLKSLVAEGAARGRIIFTGWVANDAKLSLIEGASLFALPSHQENFGISVVESMACGVPVLVTPGVNLATAIVGAEAGWAVERSQPELVAALRQAMVDQSERLRLGTRGILKKFMACVDALRAVRARDSPRPGAVWV